VKELDALTAAIGSLGAILELDRRWYSGEPTTVAEARALRAEIQEVLDRPRCAYDDAALALYRVLKPRDRGLIGEDEPAADQALRRPVAVSRRRGKVGGAPAQRPLPARAGAP
jgi:hypothetical protein